MAEIHVEPAGPNAFQVEVREGHETTTHRVTASDDELQRYGGVDDPQALVRASFEFLLEREPAESILASFALSTIERYFPEYPAEIRAR